MKWGLLEMYRVYHAEIGGNDEILDAERHRGIGFFTTEATARACIEALRTKPGFSDWPDGFRGHESRIDLVYWWGGGYGREIESFGVVPEVAAVLPVRPGQVVYQVTSFNKPEAEVGDVFDDEDGPRHIGTFTAHDLAEAAIRIVREDPEFRTRQDGFRITEFVIDEPAFPEGY